MQLKKKALLWLSLVTVFAAGVATAQTAEMPAPITFKVGDKWEWRNADSRTNLEIGKRTRTVVDEGGRLKFFSGSGSSQISDAFIGRASWKSWRVWPLEVGKKWAAEWDWTNPNGNAGITKQDVEVVAYEEVTVPAGKFMAFKIEHRGWYTNTTSRGGRGKMNETFWYAPDAKADVKYTYDDGDDQTTRELISYKSGAR